MSQQLKTYDADRVSVTFGGIILDGYGEDTFVKIEQSSERFRSKVGANGEVVRSKSRDFRAKVTVTLSQTSLSNLLLSQQAEIDRLTSLGIAPLRVADLNGTSLHFGDKAWIAEMPKSEYGRDSGDREWVFEVAELVEDVNGQVV